MAKRRKGGHRKGKKLSAAHRKAISLGLRRYHKSGKRKHTRKGRKHRRSRAPHEGMHKKRKYHRRKK
jgi:hypothetical protein